jgi:hypothetical protein
MRWREPRGLRVWRNLTYLATSRIPSRILKGKKTGGRDFVCGDPRAGRPEGARDRLPRGSIRLAFQQLIEAYQGHELMVAAIVDALKAKGRVGLGYMELAARVLDKAQDVTGSTVVINFISNLDKRKLRKSRPPAKPSGR